MKTHQKLLQFKSKYPKLIGVHFYKFKSKYPRLMNVLDGPQELQVFQPSAGGDKRISTSASVGGRCMADEKQCRNMECVKSDYVCDGEADCRDRTDEENCPSLRSCEPNEFRCGNSRCVQKMWLCDGDDDCGDRSDEASCGKILIFRCRTEFAKNLSYFFGFLAFF